MPISPACEVKPARSPRSESERRAVGQHGLQHVALRGPALDAALGAHLEPVGAAEQHVDALIARHHVEYRVPAPGPRVQLQVRRGDEHLQILRAPLTAEVRQQSEQQQTRESKRQAHAILVDRHGRVERVVEVLRANIQPL